MGAKRSADKISAEIKDWMLHSLALVRAQTRKPAEWRDMQALHREQTIMQFVLQNLDVENMTGSATVWRDYMVAHARLQVARDRREIGEREFYAACAALIQERDRLDEGVRHQSWMLSQERAG